MVSIKDDNNVVELKEKLDELLIEYMSQLDLYQSNQVELSKELKIGYFDLARSKQALGPTRMSSSSFDLSEYLSRVAITISASSDKNVSDSSTSLNYDLNPSTSSLDPLLTSITPSSPITSSTTSTTTTTATLRNRSKPSTTSTTPPPPSTTPTSTSTATTPTPRPLSRDPIYQFSAFPPPCLKETQKSFERVLKISVDRVSILSRLSKLEKEIEMVRSNLK